MNKETIYNTQVTMGILPNPKEVAEHLRVYMKPRYKNYLLVNRIFEPFLYNPDPMHPLMTDLVVMNKCAKVETQFWSYLIRNPRLVTKVLETQISLLEKMDDDVLAKANKLIENNQLVEIFIQPDYYHLCDKCSLKFPNEQALAFHTNEHDGTYCQNLQHLGLFVYRINDPIDWHHKYEVDTL